MPRIFGKIWLLDGKWHIQGEPHLLMRAKRVFARIWAGEHGVVTLKNTDEICRDITWFLDRFPMDLSPGDKRILRRGSDRHIETMATLDQLIDQNYTGREFKMGLPPRDYQKLAASILLERGFLLLADELGTGKTVSALAALTDKRTLPAIVVTLTGTMPMQWQSMTWRFMPSLTTHVVTKGTPYELPKIKGKGPDVVIINYHKMNGWAETLAAYGKSIIFDECQELRRAESNKYSAAVHVARQMKFRLGCSATPIFNLGGEIWNVVNVLQEDALGTWEEFLREWCYGDRGYAGRAPAVRDPKALGSYLKSEHIMLRRTRKDIGRELPPLTKVPQYIESDESAINSVADSAAQLAKIILSNEKTAGWDRMKASEEFSQVMRQATGVAKAPYVADFVRMIVDGDDEPVVVFAWHRAVYDILLSKLTELAPAMYTGTESAGKKQEALDRFLKGETKVLLMSLRSGVGVDGLQHICRTAVFAELDWTPGVHDQCIGRVFRDGQKEPVTAVFLVAERGADPVMAETLGLKTAQLEGIRDPDKPLVETKVDTNHIRKLAERYLQKGSKKQEIQFPKEEEEKPEEEEIEDEAESA